MKITAKIIASKRLALFLIIALAVVAVVGMTIPQQTAGKTGYENWKVQHSSLVRVVEALQLNKIFSSWWIKGIFSLLLINILSCTYLQYRRLLKSRRNVDSCPKFREIQVSDSTHVNGLVEGYLVKKRYKIIRGEDDRDIQTVRGQKFGFSRWSTVVFHAGLLLIIAGVMVSALGKTDGIIPLMEGQEVTENKENYVSLDKGALAGGYTGKSIMMEKISVDMDQRTKNIKSFEELIRFGGTAVKLDNRNSAVSQGFTLYRDKIGYTLTVNIVKGQGSKMEVTFPMLKEQGNPNIYGNEVNLPDTSFALVSVLYPDAVRRTEPGNAGYFSGGDALLNPVVNFDVRDYAKGKIKNAFLRLGEKMTVNSYTIGLEKIGYWGSIRLVRDPGVNVIYAGFAVTAAALVLVYLFVPKEICVLLKEQGMVEIRGRTSHFGHLFREELQELALLIEKEGGA